VRNKARTIWSIVLFTALAAVAGIAFNQTTPTAPLVALPDSPIYVNGSKAKANLTLALSVETPTLGTAYNSSTFEPTRKYIGYFDPMVCYINISSPDSEYFRYRSHKTTIESSCPSGTSFDGNFMNWATTSAIDIMRYGLTGGHRVVDGEGKTILERAYLPDRMYRDRDFFPTKVLPANQISLRTPFASNVFPNGMHISNCRNRVYFAKSTDFFGRCDQPFRDPTSQSAELVKGGDTTKGRFYLARVQVCDADTASSRPMIQDPITKRWGGLCLPYKNASNDTVHKPVGQLQVNADNVRVSVFAYMNVGINDRYGGVMRAPLKYLGPRQFDANFNLLPTANPHSEWDAVTGVFMRNPQLNNADYGDQGYGQSGAITYINGFSALNPDALGATKDGDALSELYYESFRYLQGQQPTPEAISGLKGTKANDKAITENFPAYTVWRDPFAGFTDNKAKGRSCLRNSVLAIADTFTYYDRYLPGNTLTAWPDSFDRSRPADIYPVPLDVEQWTKVVGSFEAFGPSDSASFIKYKDSNGVERNAHNLLSNAPLRTDRANIAASRVELGGEGSSYLMAGLALFANTQSFRTDLPKARISTYAIDVNERNRAVESASLRRGTQLHLAAKYGGFDDALTGNTGNPYALGNNALWQGADGDAKNYFVVSDPQKFLDSIADVFTSLLNETSSIAGGALSSQELRSSAGNAVFQGGFNPAAGEWSGRVRKFALTLSEDKKTTTIATVPAWDAADELTKRTLLDQGVDRNIVVGPPVGEQGTTAPSAFVWDALLAGTHKTALNKSFLGTSDTLGLDRLAYIRGSRNQERSAAQPQGPFRARTSVLGSVVNSGLVYQGAPSSAITGTGYSTFQQTHKNRTPVVFVNANDGMLHAFRASDGREQFAYVPGFIVPKLTILPDLRYTHRPLLDATPTVSEAYVDGQWRSVLVSGAGGGAQGIFALDVTEPDSFSKDKVLWEFTDADHPAMGNVLGKPHIVRVRMEDSNSGTFSYKWMALVPSGVNNHRSDAYTNATANPSIFLLDLEARPSPSAGWQEGRNFWRIDLPPGDSSSAPGVIQIMPLRIPGSGVLDAIVAGDLHGNVWKLSFRNKGVGTLGTNGLTNLRALNAMGENLTPFFVARSSDDKRQPITSTPVVATGFGGKRLIVVGTGKFLETADNSIPSSPGSSVYVLLEDARPIADRTKLRGSSINTEGVVSGSSSVIGTDDNQGWYIDLSNEVGERQVSEMQLDRGTLVFTTLMPVSGACGDGSGRIFEIDVLTGAGSYVDSTVGLLGGPMLLNRGKAVVSNSDTAGRRTATYYMDVLTQGANGLDAGGGSLSFTVQVGRMTWRQVHNHRNLVP
jgi:type IV pilus assembly protein PilY1